MVLFSGQAGARPPPTHRLHAIAGNAVWRSYIPTHVSYTTLMGNWRARGMLDLATPQTPLREAARLLQTLHQTLRRCYHCRQQHRMASRSCFSANRYNTRSDECTTRLAPRATHRRWWATQSVKE